MAAAAHDPTGVRVMYGTTDAFVRSLAARGRRQRAARRERIAALLRLAEVADRRARHMAVVGQLEQAGTESERAQRARRRARSLQTPRGVAQPL